MTARARSWVRHEDEGVTVIAARPDRREGDVVPWELSGIIQTTAEVAVSSLEDAAISDARSLGLVAATNGTVRFRTTRSGTPTVTAVVGGREVAWEALRDGDWIEADFRVRADGEPVEWYRIQFGD